MTPAMKGAIIGEHRVMITEATNDARRGAKQSADGTRYWTDVPVTSRPAAAADWPTKFTDGSLTMQVPAEGTDELRFDLTR